MAIIEVENNIIQVAEGLLTDTLREQMIRMINFCGTSGNRIIFNGEFKMGKPFQIIFKGNDNILFLEAALSLGGARVVFNGSNSVIYLNKPLRDECLNECAFNCGNECTIYIGDKVIINSADKKRFMALEHQNIIIGNECLFSHDILLRTNDAHIIYDLKTRKRTNLSGSILIGDHVWIAKGVTINKNVQVGSGSIIGSGAIAGNKVFPSNCICAGIPCKVIKKGVIMDRRGTSWMTPEETEKYAVCDTDNWIYEEDENTLKFVEIDNEIKRARTSNEKLDIIIKRLQKKVSKNRFAIV